MAKPKPPTFVYQPAAGRFVPDLKPGDTVKPRDAAEAAALESNPCFSPVKGKADRSGSTRPKRRREE